MELSPGKKDLRPETKDISMIKPKYARTLKIDKNRTAKNHLQKPGTKVPHPHLPTNHPQPKTFDKNLKFLT
ncbi:MAG: hypothetical protein ACQEV7_20090 [Bacillota bacterium]